MAKQKQSLDYKGTRKPVRDICIKILNKNYRDKAFDRDLEFTLSKERFEYLISQNCTYCGRPPFNKLKYYHHEFPYNGIDRKNSSVGYTDDNSITCCIKCNKSKGKLNSEDFIEMAFKIQQNLSVKNPISEKKLSYYYDRAVAVSKLSPDPSTKVGALLIHGDSGAVIAEGYNGFVRGAPDHLIPKTRPEKYDYIIHAEMNLICNAVRHGISTDKCVIFCTISPCVKCMRALYQAGIREVYVKGFYTDFNQCSSMLDLSMDVTTIGEFSKIELKPKKD